MAVTSAVRGTGTISIQPENWGMQSYTLLTFCSTFFLTCSAGILFWWARAEFIVWSSFLQNVRGWEEWKGWREGREEKEKTPACKACEVSKHPLLINSLDYILHFSLMQGHIVRMQVLYSKRLCLIFFLFSFKLLSSLLSSVIIETLFKFVVWHPLICNLLLNQPCYYLCNCTESQTYLWQQE